MEKKEFLLIELSKKVKLDIKSNGKELNEFTKNYILEETLLDYLISMMKARLQNDHIIDAEKWILNSYHGKPHRTHVFLYQQNFFNLKSENIYEDGWYDLETKKLYEFKRLDIETFDF